VSAVAVDPAHASVIYAATFGGGVFKSTNGGHTWRAINHGLSNLFVQGLAVDPLTPSTLFAATDGAGGGVFRSADGGATWVRRLGPGPFRSVVIDPINPSNVYAGASARGFGAVYRSSDGGDTWNTGVFTDVLRDLAIDPIAPSNLYAATNAGIFKSTDGGATFVLHQVTASPNIVTAVAVAPGSPSTVYVGLQFGPVLKSTDGGITWAFRSSGLLGGEVHQLVVNPSNPFTIYAATDTGLYKTINGADNWAASRAGITTRIINAVAIDPVNPERVRIGALGTSDTFVLGFRQDGSIRYSSYLGGNMEETGGGIAVGRDRRVYVSGGTSSTDFPTVGPLQPASAGSADAFVTILSRNRHRRHHR
jgi:photosystem II stability/assembly factor-like uncharacterized protein